jgi:fructose-1,6-bisphosphatase/inositol monophosphatase family enzyme
MSELNLGPINGHIVGRVMKEAVRRATVVIRSERLVFEAHVKEGYGGNMDDVFTTADRKAQDVYLRTIRECFPSCGIVAEEDALTIAPSNGCNAVFSVDPLDGTKAFVRRQSHGVGTMVALVIGNNVVSAYVGDINTDEIYGYRPGSNSVHRITHLDTFEKLGYEGGDRLSESYVLLRDPPEAYCKLVRKTLPAFRTYESSGGSIGIWAARLWKREVAALILPPGWETPWDSNPVIGISKKLGYVFLKPDVDRESEVWTEYDPAPVLAKHRREHDTLIIHRHDCTDLMKVLTEAEA